MMEWEAFDKVQPIGGKRWDFYFARILMTLTNIAVASHGKKGSKLFDLKDFWPNWTGEEDEPEVMAEDEIKKFFIEFAKEHNKTVRKQKQRDTRLPKRRQK